MGNFKENAVNLFQQGYSCSEAVVRAAHQSGLIDENIDINLLNKAASAFSGGMGNGCLCGAVAGAQMIIGVILGRKDINGSPKDVKLAAKKLIDDFKEKRKTTCCKALSAKSDFNSPERRQNCVNIVSDAAQVLESIVKENSKELAF